MDVRRGVGIDERTARLTGSDRASFDEAVRALALVQVHGSPGDIFDAIARCVPIAGGLIGVLGGDAASSPVSHIVKLPDTVIEGWASTPSHQLARMLAPMVGAGPGELISDTQAIVGPFRDEIALLRRLDDAGLGESAGYKVSTHRAASGRPVHSFMTFALERGGAFDERHRHTLALLRPFIHDAQSRIGVPLIASQSILAQIVNEQSIGFMCVARTGRIVEVNQRMHALAIRYLRAARTEGGRGALARFADRARAETAGGRTWQLRAEDGSAVAEVSAHRLAKESHSIGDDVVLLMMKELVLSPAASAGELTDRQQEIAKLLVGTGLSYKQIADRLGISEGTVRKHVEHVYRSAGVHSRAELAIKLR